MIAPARRPAPFMTCRLWNVFNHAAFPAGSNGKDRQMVRAFILWMMGVPLILVLLIWYFFF